MVFSSCAARAFFGCGVLVEFLGNLDGQIQHLLRWDLQNQCALLIQKSVNRGLARRFPLHLNLILRNVGLRRVTLRVSTFPKRITSRKRLGCGLSRMHVSHFDFNRSRRNNRKCGTHAHTDYQANFAQ